MIHLSGSKNSVGIEQSNSLVISAPEKEDVCLSFFFGIEICENANLW